MTCEEKGPRMRNGQVRSPGEVSVDKGGRRQDSVSCEALATAIPDFKSGQYAAPLVEEFPRRISITPAGTGVACSCPITPYNWLSAPDEAQSPAVVAGEGMPDGISGKGERRQVGLSPCVISGASRLAPSGDTGADVAPLVEDFKPIRALLPVWTDEITGEVLDLDELRRALCGE
jgi:hypothetical protein